jgi:DNA-binding response OmpR family regulator
MNILVVEDDQRVADFLGRGLRSDGHNVTHVDNGIHGLEVARDGTFDIVILDLMLPGMHGTELCQKLRIGGSRVPVLMLTAMDSLEDKVGGLRLGADDYLTKPFAFDELVARIDALTRRSRNFQAKASVLAVGDLQLDREAIQVRCRDGVIELTGREFTILELLMSSPGKVVSRTRILANVWGYDSDPLTNVVDVYISRLRRKIEAAGSRTPIETSRGFGYRLAPVDPPTP